MPWRGGIEEGDDRIWSYATLRTVDFIKELRHKVMEDTGKAFHDHVKQAQEEVWHQMIISERSCLGIFPTQAS